MQSKCQNSDIVFFIYLQYDRKEMVQTGIQLCRYFRQTDDSWKQFGQDAVKLLPDIYFFENSSKTLKNFCGSLLLTSFSSCCGISL